MSEITVTSEKVNVNGRDGYIAIATNGFVYTQTHRHDVAKDAENVAVRLLKDGVVDGYVEFDDRRDLCTDDGLTPEAPRQTIQYHEGFHFDIVTFLLAALVVVVVVFLSCPLLTTLLHSF